jgi:hypothetical protein
VRYLERLTLFGARAGLSATQLLEEAVEDMKRDPRERKGVILHRLLGYYNWADYRISSTQSRKRENTLSFAKGFDLKQQMLGCKRLEASMERSILVSK